MKNLKEIIFAQSDESRLRQERDLDIIIAGTSAGLGGAVSAIDWSLMGVIVTAVPVIIFSAKAVFTHFEINDKKRDVGIN